LLNAEAGGGKFTGLNPPTAPLPDLLGGGGSRMPPAPKPEGFCLATPLDVSVFFYNERINEFNIYIKLKYTCRK
jgi:hypothetical protein